MFPKVIVKIDKEFDQEIFLYFIDEKIGDFDFGYERIVKDHPDVGVCCGKNIEERRTVTEPYATEYYNQHMGEIQNAKIVMQIIWDEISDHYFHALENIFGKLDFYKEKELFAFLSIAKCGVIGEDKKDFQIWYKTVGEPEEVRRHFAHEILHFYYYTYVEKQDYKNLVENWDLAEIFNVVVLSLPEFIAIIDKADEGYVQHEKYFSYYKKLWRESSGLDEYLKRTDEEGLVGVEKLQSS